MARIVVLGGAGFIGSHTVDVLLREGHDVVAIDDFSSGSSANLAAAAGSSRCRVVRGDATEPDWLKKQLREGRPDAIVHLAALVSVQSSLTDPALNFRLNVALTQRVIEAAWAIGVSRIVFASSAAVYGNLPADRLPIAETHPTQPISPYGAAKLASEALLLGQAQCFGYTAVCLRYFNAYGPRQTASSPYSGVISSFLSRASRGESPLVHGDGEQTRDFVHVRDIAEANVKAATALLPGSLVANVCSGRETSVNQLLHILRRERPDWAAPTHLERRAGDIVRSVGSCRRISSTIGWEASIPLSDGLRELAGARNPIPPGVSNS